MKAITIHQPYAELIARGAKRLENRTWPTRYRGALAIHAGLSRRSNWREAAAGFGLDWQALPLGAIVAVAELADCVHIDDVEGSLRTHEHTVGPWCWVLENVRRLPEPIAMSGRRRLWVVDTTILAAIEGQLGILALERATADR